MMGVLSRSVRSITMVKISGYLNASFADTSPSGSGTSIRFPSLVSSSILLTITSVSQTTSDVGLTEVQVFFDKSAK